MGGSAHPPARRGVANRAQDPPPPHPGVAVAAYLVPGVEPLEVGTWYEESLGGQMLGEEHDGVDGLAAHLQQAEAAQRTHLRCGGGGASRVRGERTG